MSGSPSDLDRARNGDREALDRLLGRVQDRLVHRAEASMGHDLRARLRVSDVVQSAYVDIMRSIGHFKGGTDEAFMSWAAQVLENKVRRKGRFFSAQKRHGVEDPIDLDTEARPAGRGPTTPSAEVSRIEDFRLVSRALANLREDHRRVLVLRGVDGRNHREIAGILGRSETAARMLLSRARVALSLELERLEGAPGREPEGRRPDAGAHSAIRETPT